MLGWGLKPKSHTHHEQLLLNSIFDMSVIIGINLKQTNSLRKIVNRGINIVRREVIGELWDLISSCSTRDF